MAFSAWIRRWRFLGVAAAMAIVVGALEAGEGRARPKKIGDYNPDDPTVEMFEAIEKGDIVVKLIPKNSTQARVLIENKTAQPLNVKLPEAFAGVPALAQFGGDGGGGGSSRGSSGGGSQSTGGGMGGMGGMGMFNVPPEKVGQLKVTTVCLEHGKAEPREQIPYEIRPLETVTTKSGVRDLCVLLGTGKIPQRAAQVAAWHLNSDMSFQELAGKTIKHANGAREPYFSQKEMQAGMQIVTAIAEQVRQRASQDVETTESLGK